MFNQLNNPEYLHVLLNPLPVYGLAVGALGLAIALLFQSRAARVTALLLIGVSCLSAWPVYHYGQAGYDRVLSMADADGGKWLEEHMRRAEKLIFTFYAVAGLAAAAGFSELKFRRAAVPIAAITLIAAVANLGIGGYIAYAGGRVRHREFRLEPPPAPPADEHHHDH